jgi:hypothetical protein
MTNLSIIPIQLLNAYLDGETNLLTEFVTNQITCDLFIELYTLSSILL